MTSSANRELGIAIVEYTHSLSNLTGRVGHKDACRQKVAPFVPEIGAFECVSRCALRNCQVLEHVAKLAAGTLAADVAGSVALIQHWLAQYDASSCEQTAQQENHCIIDKVLL